jgi:hypothetical protein
MGSSANAKSVAKTQNKSYDVEASVDGDHTHRRSAEQRVPRIE